MNKSLLFSLVWIFAAACSPVFGQLDSTVAYCNLFYVTTDNAELMPFQDHCFVNLNYEIKKYPTVRVVGPMKSSHDFFREYDWSLQFHLPEMNDRGILTVSALPQDLSPESIPMEAGKFFISVSDNRVRRYYGENSHKVDYVAVEGKAKINEYASPKPGWSHPELQAQIDVYVQQIVQGEQGPKLVGPKIRLKCVLVVENRKE